MHSLTKVTLNAELQVDQHPMLIMQNIFAFLGGSQYFSKTDLSQAFNQIELSPESWRLTTINTPWGLFQYTRLCLGLQIPISGVHVVSCGGRHHKMGRNYSGKRSHLSADYADSEYHFCKVWLANPNLVRQWHNFHF